MRRSSVYYALRYVVQCSWPDKPFFESMCAFDLADAAIEYAAEAFKKQTVDGFRYRVIDHRNNEDRVVHRCGYVEA